MNKKVWILAGVALAAGLLIALGASQRMGAHPGHNHDGQHAIKMDHHGHSHDHDHPHPHVHEGDHTQGHIDDGFDAPAEEQPNLEGFVKKEE